MRKIPLLRAPLTKAYLQDRFVDKRWSYYQIYKETGWSKASISKAIGDHGLRRKRNLRGVNLVGQIFGSLTVVSAAEKKRRANYWLCTCACGSANVQVTTGNLLSGNTTSCGCRKHRSGEQSATWKGKTALSVRYWHILQNGAGKRGIYIGITIDDAWEVFVRQGGKCALTGWDIQLSSSTSQTASLDRIDSSKGYVKGNIQWVHKDVNRAKNVLSQPEFIRMCESVAAYSRVAAVRS